MMKPLPAPLPVLFVFLLLVIVTPSRLLAHNPGLSSAHIQVFDDRIELSVTLPSEDAGWFMAWLTETRKLEKGGEIQENAAVIAHELGGLFLGNTRIKPRSSLLLPPIEPGELSVTVTFDHPGRKTIEYRAGCFEALPRGHFQLVVAIQNLDTLAEAILDRANTTLGIPLE
ncbi:MAG: hypothetical protein ACREIA_02335 [Opitutaceae bacterium]